MSESSSPTLSSEAGSADPLDLAHLSTGERWREVYQIGDPLPDQSMGRSFRAVHLARVQDVIIRSFRSPDSVRARTWEALKSTEGMVECIDAVEFDGRRVEVTATPPAMSLREWSAGRKAGAVEVKKVLTEVTRILAALQERGVVHLNLRPEKIHVASMDGGLSLLLGGLESATLLDQGGLVTAVVQPFYAPPETVGLYQHSPGRSLKAWDWWSLGRILQEMVLGRHVLGHLLERDVTRQTPELISRAEALLGENDGSGMRAGAVESMPAMDKDLHVVLKGLLTSCRDARWSGGEVQRWLANEAVKERYHLPKNERLFIWKDRAFTVAEAAEYFGTSDQWKDGVTNLFNPTDSRTLVYFLNEAPGMGKVKEKLDTYIKMKDSMALNSIPMEIKQDLICCVAWGFLSAGTAKPRLFGRELNGDCLRELLADEMLPNGLLYLKGLLSRAVLQHIEQQDKEASRFLTEFDKVVQAALTIAKSNGWVVEDNHVEVAKIMRNCLEKDTALRKDIDLMRAKYACSRIVLLDRMFKKPAPTQAELALVAFTQIDPTRFEYVTHAEWNTEHYRSLRERGERLAKAITWMNLEMAFRKGPLVFGRWQITAIVWGVLALLIAMSRQWIMLGVLVLFPAAVLAGFKYLWLSLNKRTLESQLQPGERWKYLDGPARCQDLALAALDVASPPEISDLRRSFAEINQEIAKIPLDPPPVKIAPPKRCVSAWLVSLASWGLSLVALAAVGWTLWNHPPQLPKMVTSVVSGRRTSEKPDLKDLKQQEGKGFAKAISAEKEKEPEMTEEEIAEDNAALLKAMETLRKLQEEEAKLPKPPPKIAWRFKQDPHPQIVNIRGAVEATPDQIAAGTRVATATLSRFDPSTIDAVVAVRVPTDKGVGIMLWDGKTGRFTNKTVIKMNYVPLARSWLDVGGSTVFFLGTQ